MPSQKYCWQSSAERKQGTKDMQTQQCKHNVSMKTQQCKVWGAANTQLQELGAFS